MRVLFAVNNEKISEAITKKYQSMYKEIISGKKHQKWYLSTITTGWRKARD